MCQTLVRKLKGGRTGAFEIMLATPAIRHLIRQDMIAQMQTTIQTSGDVGMRTMEQYLPGAGDESDHLTHSRAYGDNESGCFSVITSIEWFYCHHLSLNMKAKIYQVTHLQIPYSAAILLLYAY